MFPFGFGGQFGQGEFGQGGITFQIDMHLSALREATIQDDARLYANLVAQLAAICRPKLMLDEFQRLSVPTINFKDDPKLTQRDNRRAYEQALFVACRANLAEILALMSERGLYAKKDESPPEISDETELRLK